jgi:DNA-binding beta-propeller fold protein YncE
VTIGKDPRGLAVDPITHAAYFAADDGTVSIIENVP